MPSLADLLVRVGVDSSSLKAGLKSVSDDFKAMDKEIRATEKAFSGFEKIGDRMSSVGAGLTAAITVPLAGVATAATLVAGKFEQSEIAFKSMLGSAEKAGVFLQQLKDFAAKTPFEFPELVESSKRMLAFGFEASKIIPTLRIIGDAVSGLGGGAAEINRVTLALGQMQAKGKVSAQEMNQLAELGIPAWKMLADAIGITIPEAMKLAERGAIQASVAIPAILEGMNAKFGGLMAEQSKTLLGQWSNFKDQLTFVAMDIGKALLPVLKAILDASMPVLEGVKGLAQQFSALSPQAQAVGIALAAAAAAAGPLLFALGSIMSSVTGLMPVITSIGSALGTVGLAAAAQAAAVALAAFAVVWAGWKYQDHILGIQLAIAAYNTISASVSFFWNLLKGFIATVVNVGSVIADKLETPLKLLAIPLGLVIDAYEWLTAQLRAFNAQFAKAPDIGPLKDIKKALADVTKGLGDSSKAGTDFGKVSEQMRKLLDKSSDATKEAAKQAKELAKEHQFGLRHARDFMDSQPLLAAKLRLVDAEYKKNVESLAALKLALDRNGGIVWSFDQFALATDRLGTEIGHLGTSVRDLPPMPGYTGTIKELDDLGKAYERMGVKTTGELRKVAEQHQADFNRIKGSGIATAHELDLAWWKLMESLADAARQAGEEIPFEIEAMLSVGTKHTKEATEKQKNIWGEFGKSVSTVITNFAQDISKSLWDGDISWGEKGKNLLKSLGQAVTSSFIEPATAAIGKFINGVLADLLSGKGLGGVLGHLKDIGSAVSGAFGGGNTPSVPTGGGGSSIPTGGGGGGAAGAASSLGGTVDIVTGAISAAANVVSAIYNVRMEGTMNAIEENTRKAQIVLLDTLGRANEFWPSMRDTHAALVDLILPTMREMRDGMKNLFAVNLSLTPGDERNLINSLLTRFATPDTLSSDRLLDIHARLGNVLTAVQDTRKGIVETIASSTQLLVGGLAAIENKLPSTIGNILGGIGGLGGIAGAVSGLVGSLITGLINRGQGEAIDLIEENTRYAAIGIVGPHGVVESMREFLPEMKAVRELSGQFLDAHAWRIHDVWERIGTLIDVVKFDTNAHLWGIHEALVTAGPREVHNHFEGATFANRSDIDYAVEQISRNLR